MAEGRRDKTKPSDYVSIADRQTQAIRQRVTSPGSWASVSLFRDVEDCAVRSIPKTQRRQARSGASRVIQGAS